MSNSGGGTVYTVLNDDVYRSTTVPTSNFSLMESFKKLLSSNSSPGPSLPDAIVTGEPSEHETFIERGPRPRFLGFNMPASSTAEETALLGTVPPEINDDIELKSVTLAFPSARTLDKNVHIFQEEYVKTPKGSVLIAVQGDRAKPAIFTYHDLGLNYVANFQAFFNFSEMRSLIQNFCVYHINAPGQEEGAATLPETFIYPTMDELGEQLTDIMLHFGLKTIIGLGVGAGANVLSRFALFHPEKVDALCLLNCVSTTAGWIEWGYQKVNARHLRSKGMTQGALDYLMWHHFGRLTEERNHDLVHVYREYFERLVNPVNLAMFIDSYVRRTDFAIARDPDTSAGIVTANKGKTLRVPVLNMTGAMSPHVDDTVVFNGRLDPGNSTWMKLQDCGMILEEQPAKVVEAFRLFLQGNGYAIKLARKSMPPINEATPVSSPTTTIPLTPLSSSPTNFHVVTPSPDSDTRYLPGNSSPTDMHITENPISVTSEPAAVLA